jgi:hypothetical protein
MFPLQLPQMGAEEDALLNFGSMVMLKAPPPEFRQIPGRL